MNRQKIAVIPIRYPLFDEQNHSFKNVGHGKWKHSNTKETIQDSDEKDNFNFFMCTKSLCENLKKQ